MARLAIVGSGHLGQQIALHATQDSTYDVIGYFDDYKTKGVIVNGIEVLGGVKDIKTSFKNQIFDDILIGIGYKHMNVRKALFEELKEDVPFGRFVHSSCIIDPTCQIGAGVIIYPGTILDQRVEIGDNVLINVGCTICHDSKISSHSFISPRVAIAGFVDVGQACILGINSTIIDNINIAPNSQLGAGSVIIKNITKAGLYVGSPSRFIR